MNKLESILHTLMALTLIGCAKEEGSMPRLKEYAHLAAIRFNRLDDQELIEVGHLSAALIDEIKQQGSIDPIGLRKITEDFASIVPGETPSNVSALNDVRRVIVVYLINTQNAKSTLSESDAEWQCLCIRALLKRMLQETRNLRKIGWDERKAGMTSAVFVPPDGKPVQIIDIKREQGSALSMQLLTVKELMTALWRTSDILKKTMDQRKAYFTENGFTSDEWDGLLNLVQPVEREQVETLFPSK